MRLSYRLKHHFFSAFREFFVHHHGSLDFRAKIFALVIAADENSMIENYILVKKLALKIYNKDEHRATLLVNSTREIVEKIYESNNLYMDTLIENIKNDLKIVPRYAHKIDLDALKTIVNLTEDIDTAHYQHNIVEFLENLKKETLSKKNSTAK